MVVEDRLARVEGILDEMRSQINARLESIENRMLRVEDRLFWVTGMVFTAGVTTVLSVLAAILTVIWRT